MKLIFGIILIVLGGMGLVGGVTNGSLLSINFMSADIFYLIGYLAVVGLFFYFGVRLIKKSK